MNSIHRVFFWAFTILLVYIFKTNFYFWFYLPGFAFVTFESEDVVDKVCEIHFHEINNKMVSLYPRQFLPFLLSFSFPSCEWVGGCLCVCVRACLVQKETYHKEERERVESSLLFANKPNCCYCFNTHLLHAFSIVMKQLDQFPRPYEREQLSLFCCLGIGRKEKFEWEKDVVVRSRSIGVNCNRHTSNTRAEFIERRRAETAGL
jgi:hypothetical protein